MSLLEGLDGFVDGDCGEEGVGAEIVIVRSELYEDTQAVRGGNLLEPVRSFGTSLLQLLVLCCGILTYTVRLALHINRGTDAGKRYTRIMLPSFVFILFADLFFIILSVFQGGILRGWFSRFKPDAGCSIITEKGD